MSIGNSSNRIDTFHDGYRDLLTDRRIDKSRLRDEPTEYSYVQRHNEILLGGEPFPLKSIALGSPLIMTRAISFSRDGG